jgi:ribosomal protein L12E/L44/L45/RPP1/RPP2
MTTTIKTSPTESRPARHGVETDIAELLVDMGVLVDEWRVGEVMTLVADARREALEEAAEVCASAARESATKAAEAEAADDPDGRWMHARTAHALRAAETAIRALKEQP